MQLTAQLEGREGELKRRIGEVDAQILRNGREMRAARPGTQTERLYKQRAKQFVKQKRVMEKRLHNTINRLNLLQKVAVAKEEVKFAMEMDAFAKQDAADAHVGIQEVRNVSLETQRLGRVMEDCDNILEDIDGINQVFAGDMLGSNADDQELEDELNDEMEQQYGRGAQVDKLPLPHGEAPDIPSVPELEELDQSGLDDLEGDLVRIRSAGLDDREFRRRGRE